MTIELDPDRRLALAYAPARARPALEALWRLDVTLGGVLQTGRDRMAKQLRLAWWREALERLDTQPAPAEPVLEGLAAYVLPAGVTGAELAAMEEGWLHFLADGPLTEAALGDYAVARGGALFRLGARLLGRTDVAVERAGRRWALVDFARRSADPAEGRAARALAAAIAEDKNWPAELRPLGILAIMASRDLARGPEQLERQGSPARMLRMLSYRISGR